MTKEERKQYTQFRNTVLSIVCRLEVEYQEERRYGIKKIANELNEALNKCKI